MEREILQGFYDGSYYYFPCGITHRQGEPRSRVRTYCFLREGDVQIVYRHKNSNFPEDRQLVTDLFPEQVFKPIPEETQDSYEQLSREQLLSLARKKRASVICEAKDIKGDRRGPKTYLLKTLEGQKTFSGDLKTPRRKLRDLVLFFNVKNPEWRKILLRECQKFKV